MPPLSKMKRLPPEVREEVHRLFADGVTIEQVTAHLRELGHQVTLGGVGRYRRYWAERIQPALDFGSMVAEAIEVRDLLEKRDGRLVRVEFVEASTAKALPEGEAGPKKARRASGKASTQKDKDGAQ